MKQLLTLMVLIGSFMLIAQQPLYEVSTKEIKVFESTEVGEQGELVAIVDLPTTKVNTMKASHYKVSAAHTPNNYIAVRTKYYDKEYLYIAEPYVTDRVTNSSGGMPG